MEDDAVSTAERVYVSVGSSIDADAIRDGDGGKVVVWSDGITIAAGALSARGGSERGNGGFIETSGKQTLQMTGSADVAATNGSAGSWLLDPRDLQIGGSIFSTTLPSPGVPFTPFFASTRTGTGFYSNGFSTTSYVSRALLEQTLNAGTNVYMFADNIRIAESITKSSGGSAYLTFNALDDLRVGRNVRFVSTSGRLRLQFFAQNGDAQANSMGRIDLNGGWFFVGGRRDIRVSTASFRNVEEVMVYAESDGNPGFVSVSDKSNSDRARYSHDGQTATIKKDGLRISQDDTRYYLRFRNLDLALANGAFNVPHARWRFRLSGTGAFGAFGAVTADADDGKPEIISSSNRTSFIGSFKDPGTSKLKNLLEEQTTIDGKTRLYDTKTGELIKILNFGAQPSNREQKVVNQEIRRSETPV